MIDYWLGQEDDLPLLTAILKDANGAAIPLVDGDMVTVRIWQPGDAEPVVSEECSLVTETTGKISFNPAGLVDELSGLYRIEFRIVFTGGARQRVPNKGRARAQIQWKSPAPA